MTKEEHTLMLLLFAKQAQLAKLVVDLFKHSGIVSQDDVSAFEFSVTQDVSSNAALLQQSRNVYLTLAKAAGVTVTGLEP